MLKFKVAFTGNGTEYAAIWIVNVFLTLITLGLYYPWAKVRTQRYLHGNTFTLGEFFEYHATGTMIFKGFIFAWLLFVLFALVQYFLPALASKMSIVLAILVVPWFIVLSIRFSLQMKSFNNIRFDFDGTLLRGYLIYGILPIVITIIVIGLGSFISGLYANVGYGWFAFAISLASFAIAWGWKSYLSSDYIYNNIRYGNQAFSADFEKNNFMIIYAIAITSAFLVVFVTFFLFDFSSLRHLQSTSYIQENLFHVIALLMSLLLAFFVYRAVVVGMTRNYILSRLNFMNSIKFESELNVITLLWIYVSNYFIVAFTLGLGTPWAKIRVVQYMVNTVSLELPEEMKEFIDIEKLKASPFGDQASEVFETDISGAIGF